MKKLIVASNNKDKIEEIKEILSRYSIDVISLKDAGINIEVEEDGDTFEENAYKKANEIFKIVGKEYMVLADDSGLMVDCLDGAPGVYSARFAGEHGNYKKNNEKLIYLLKDKNIEERSARFVCSVVLIIDEERVIRVQGEVHGVICDKEKGSNGFGYDPLFYISEHNMTFAEMDSQLKNSISHRANALEKLKQEINEVIGG